MNISAKILHISCWLFTQKTFLAKNITAYFILLTIMRVYNQAVFFISMMLFGSLLSNAQNFSNYQYFGSESGLSDKQVKCILQDKKGLMWIGTSNGLNRFDGKNFLNINDVPYSTLKGTFIHSIIDDTMGNLILGTNNGIEFFDPYTFKSTILNIERFTGKRPTFQIILFKSSKGYIYAMIGNYFLLRIDQHKRIIQVKCPDNQDGLFRNLNCITEDLNGNIWMSDFYGKIYTFKDGENSLHLFKDFGVQFHRINFTKKLGLLISSDYGLFRFDTIQKTINRIYHAIGPCSNILEDKTGVIWVSDEYEKLYRIRNEILTDETKLLRLADEFNYRIGPIMQDNKSNFWVGTDFGMVKFIEAPKKFNLLFTANQKQIDNLNTSIRKFSEDTVTKDVYFASYSGVFKIDYKTQKIDSILLESDKMIIPYSVLYDDGKLWIGSEGTGFYKYDLKTKKLKRINSVISNNRRYPDKLFVVNLFKDKDGMIWISEYSSLLIFNPKTEKSTPFKLKNEGEIIQEIKVLDICRTKNDYLWLASNKGVHILDPNRKLVAHLTKSDGLPTNQIKCIVEQDDNTMWFGTAGNGIVKFNRTTKTIDIFNTSNGIIDNHINGIVPSKKDLFWISTQNGLSEFYYHKGEFVNFRMEDGLPTNEFNSSSSFISSQGQIYFGSINGIVNIPNEFELKNTDEGNLSWSKFFMRNRKHDSTIHWIDNFSTLVIPQDNYFFEIQFALSNYVNPERNIYYYKLDGLVNTWQNLDNQNILRFYELPAGEYQLRVRASSANRNMTTNELSLQLIIEQAYYKTWWFISLILFSLLLIISLIILNRLEQLKKFASLRVKISSDLHDDVGSVLTRIAMQADFAKRKTDPGTTTVFETIASSCRAAVSNMRDVIWSTDSRNDKYSSIVDRMREHAINMLEQNDIQYQLEIQLDESKYLEMNLRQHFFLIYKEAINNIVKHAHATFVYIKFRADDDSLELIVKDNGQHQDIKKTVTGSGIINMRMRAIKIHAQFEITDQDGFQIRVFKKNNYWHKILKPFIPWNN